MILPFDRSRLATRNDLDLAEERAAAARQSPAERVAIAIRLSNLIHALSLAAGTAEAADEHDDLAEKARLYAEPLRLLAARR